MYAAPNFLNDWTFVYHSLTNVTKDVNEATAQNLSLIGYPNNSQVYLGVDHTNLWPNNIWRPSIQIESHYLYNSGLFILSLDHMPTGPGVWPAFWMAGPNWPYNGEIDVLEAVDGMPHNLISILSGDNCYHYENETQFMNGNWYNPGHTQGLTCYAYAKSNATYTHSCSVNAPNNTFGPGFNKAGGGVFAVQWEKEKFIRVWNFVKPNIPIDIVQESPNPNPDTWGLPDAYFSFGSNCSPDHFNNQSIIFDIALCGGWEAGYYPGGEAACEANVKANPGNYTEAYFLINYLKVFCKPGEPCGTYYPSCQVSC
uniref:GH16 domain-containing protein n=1 Tax=Acrobeloides nanus TaxID=290746 RepID=A0A914C4F6_9BILA